MAENISSQIEVVDEKHLYQGVFTEQVATPNSINTTTIPTMQQMDHMVERCIPDEV